MDIYILPFILSITNKNYGYFDMSMCRTRCWLCNISLCHLGFVIIYLFIHLQNTNNDNNNMYKNETY